MQKFKSVEELVNQLKPDKPIYCIRKNSILSASKFFQKKFHGKILYAVKTNPNPEVIKTLIKSGINEFDVASIEEIKTIIKSLTKKNIGVLITDHNVRETLKITDKVYIVNEGSIYFEGNPDEAVKNESIKKFYLGADFKI